MGHHRQARAGDNGPMARIGAGPEDSQEEMKNRVRISPLQWTILDAAAKGPVTFAALLGPAPSPARKAALSRAVRRLVARGRVTKTRWGVALVGGAASLDKPKSK